MESINTALRLFTVSQLLLLTLIIVLSHNPLRVRLLVVLFAISILSYLGMPMMQDHADLHFLWYPSNIAPSLLLLLVWFIFEEKCTFPIWLAMIVSFGVLSSLWFRFQGIGLPDAPLWLQASKVFISVGAVLVVWIGRDNDLVEARIKARNLMVFCLSLMVAIILFIEILSEFNHLVYLDFVKLTVLFIFSLLCNYCFVKLNPQSQIVEQKPVIKEESEDTVIIELLDRMQNERLYKDHDLRVGGLAAILNIPEYKLRKKINQQLGYRNFNQFVNHYRIDEASKKLLDDIRIPVLSIALDVGFRSISSFNTAFQTQFGVSPTQYRNQNA